MARAVRNGRKLDAIKKLNEENMVNFYQQIFNPRIIFIKTLKGKNVSDSNVCVSVPYLL